MTQQTLRFTLEVGAWYAAEFIGDDLGPAAVAHSPIRLDAIQAQQSGQRNLELRFYHANYPEGVRDKVYRVQTLERGVAYLLCKCLDHKPARFLLIHALSADWLARTCDVDISREADVHRWLERHA